MLRKQFFIRTFLISSLVTLFFAAFFFDWDLQTNVVLAYDDIHKIQDFSEAPVQILMRVKRVDDKSFDVSYSVAAKGKIETLE